MDLIRRKDSPDAEAALVLLAELSLRALTVLDSMTGAKRGGT